MEDPHLCMIWLSEKKKKNKKETSPLIMKIGEKKELTFVGYIALS